MNKIEKEYERLKKKNNNKIYLFKIGNFYEFIGDDVEFVNKYMVLKPTKFSNKYLKCGFPVDKINNYKVVFKNLKFNIDIIDKIEIVDPLEKLKNTNINVLSKKQIIQILEDIKDYYG